jgi:hypothetical protein
MILLDKRTNGVDFTCDEEIQPYHALTEMRNRSRSGLENPELKSDCGRARGTGLESG